MEVTVTEIILAVSCACNLFTTWFIVKKIIKAKPYKEQIKEWSGMVTGLRNRMRTQSESLYEVEKYLANQHTTNATEQKKIITKVRDMLER